MIDWSGVTAINISDIFIMAGMIVIPLAAIWSIRKVFALIKGKIRELNQPF